MPLDAWESAFFRWIDASGSQCELDSHDYCLAEDAFQAGWAAFIALAIGTFAHGRVTCGS